MKRKNILKSLFFSQCSFNCEYNGFSAYITMDAMYKKKVGLRAKWSNIILICDKSTSKKVS